MRVRTLSLLCLLASLMIAIPLSARQGSASDPLTGTWTGDWGPNTRDRNQVSVELKWDGKQLTGVVKSTQPARPDVSLSNSSYDPATQTVKMQAEARNPRSGQTVKYTIEGKLSGGTMSGSWNHDAGKGDFTLKKS